MSVLVVGGTGATGRLVRDILHEAGVKADYSSRAGGSPPDHVAFDVSSPEAVAVLAKYDWAIACLGPFETIGDSIHRIAIAAGTNLVDVNDGIELGRRLNDLDDEAREAGVCLLTGFGLCPGLSTAMLYRAGKEVGEPTSALAELNIGPGQASGPAAVRSMFRTMRDDHHVLRNGVEVCESRQAPSADGYIGYENPDLDLVRILWPALQEYEYRVRFEVLKPRQVNMLRTSRIFTLPFVEERLARFSAKYATRTAENTVSSPTVLKTTVGDSIGGTVVMSIRGEGSYMLTAAAAAAAYLVAVDDPVSAGVCHPASAPGFTDAVLARVESDGHLTLTTE